MSRAVAMLALGSLLGASTWTVARADAPYGSWQSRPIKGLSPEEVDDLLNGRGMGLALPAELNGYPGPRHVLDLADRLGLSPEQRGRADALFGEMRAGAVALGERIIEAERELDRLFATGKASPPAIREATLEIGQLEGELRALHLGYHLAMRDVLTPDQIATYQRLRGYGAHDGQGDDHHHRAHGHSQRR